MTDSLPADTRVGAVALQVANLDRSLAFYEGVIGFHLIDRDATSGSRGARLGAPDSDRALLELHEKPGAHPVPYRGRLGIYHFAVLLPTRGDLGRFLRHATALGVHVGASDHAFSEATYLVDPDGISVEVYRDRPRAEWPRLDGIGSAINAPLDANGILSAAGEKQWDGLPAGTRIGHLHFYVGDLTAAEAFYHRALGFDKTITTFPGALFVSAGGYHHHVGLNTWAARAPVATADDAKLLFWELVLPDSAAESAAERLRRSGYSVSQAATGHEASDPWGITVRLVTPA